MLANGKGPRRLRDGSHGNRDDGEWVKHGDESNDDRDEWRHQKYRELLVGGEERAQLIK